MNTLPENPAGWWMSEKLDGCRCFLTESGTLISRHGKPFKAPPSFMRGMPLGVRLDGELYAGRGGFDFLVGEIQRKNSDWLGVTFQVFDLAVLRMPIEARHAALGRLQLPPWVKVVEHRPCRSRGDLDETEALVVGQGGEGLCLREAGSFYRPNGFIKVKRLVRDLNRSTLD